MPNQIVSEGGCPIMPKIGVPDFIKAMLIVYSFLPLLKLLVPSIGSIIQYKSSRNKSRFTGPLHLLLEF